MNTIQKINWKRLIPALLIPLAVGALAALLTKDAMARFGELRKPPLSPPAWLFPVVWTILYLLMGLASYLVVMRENSPETATALRYYALQLVFIFFWSILFFNLEAYLLAFFWLLALLLLIVVTTVLFWRIRRSAGALLLPYLLWVSFAGYLNIGIYLLQ